jgi:hypothetical protein
VRRVRHTHPVHVTFPLFPRKHFGIMGTHALELLIMRGGFEAFPSYEFDPSVCIFMMIAAVDRRDSTFSLMDY